MFELHPQLQKDCRQLGDFPLCRVLLMNDANYPWLILVPRRADITEIYQLSWEDQQQLLRESNTLCQAMVQLFTPQKMNVAALGNMVPQLHLHHIARFLSDAAWPRPVWGAEAAKPYDELDADKLCGQLVDALVGGSIAFTPG